MKDSEKFCSLNQLERMLEEQMQCKIKRNRFYAIAQNPHYATTGQENFEQQKKKLKYFHTKKSLQIFNPELKKEEEQRQKRQNRSRSKSRSIQNIQQKSQSKSVKQQSQRYVMKTKDFYEIIHDEKPQLDNRREQQISGKQHRSRSKSYTRQKDNIKQNIQQKNKWLQRSSSKNKPMKKTVSIKHQRQKSISRNNVKKEHKIEMIQRSKSKQKKSVSKAKQKKLSETSQISRSRSQKKYKTQDEINSTFKPLLSKKSLQIAQKLEKSKERLYDQNQNKRQILEHQEYLRRQSIRKLATPKINKKSKYLDQQIQNNELKRFEKLYNQSKNYQKIAKQRRQEKQREQLEKEILFKNYGQKSKSRKKILQDSGVDVSQRNEMWIQRKEQKLREIKERTQEIQLKECTFKPNLSRSKSAKKDKMGYTTEFAKEGLEKYFERIRMAKKQKEYKKNPKQKSISRKKSNLSKKKSQSKISQSFKNSDVYSQTLQEYESQYEQEFDNYGQTAPLNFQSNYNSNMNDQIQFDVNSSEKDEESFSNIMQNLRKLNKLIQLILFQKTSYFENQPQVAIYRFSINQQIQIKFFFTLDLSIFMFFLQVYQYYYQLN